jgi:hypothetical protein
LHIIAGDKRGKDAGYAQTHILTAFLGLTRHRHKGQQQKQQQRFPHSFLNLSPARNRNP